MDDDIVQDFEKQIRMQARGLLIPRWRVDLLDMFLMDDGDSSVDKLSDAEGRRIILLTEQMPEYDWKIRR